MRRSVPPPSRDLEFSMERGRADCPIRYGALFGRKARDCARDPAEPQLYGVTYSYVLAVVTSRFSKTRVAFVYIRRRAHGIRERCIIHYPFGDHLIAPTRGPTYWPSTTHVLDFLTIYLLNIPPFLSIPHFRAVSSRCSLTLRADDPKRCPSPHVPGRASPFEAGTAPTRPVFGRSGAVEMVLAPSNPSFAVPLSSFYPRCPLCHALLTTVDRNSTDVASALTKQPRRQGRGRRAWERTPRRAHATRLHGRRIWKRVTTMDKRLWTRSMTRALHDWKTGAETEADASATHDSTRKRHCSSAVWITRPGGSDAVGCDAGPTSVGSDGPSGAPNQVEGEGELGDDHAGEPIVASESYRVEDRLQQAQGCRQPTQANDPIGVAVETDEAGHVIPCDALVSRKRNHVEMEGGTATTEPVTSKEAVSSPSTEERPDEGILPGIYNARPDPCGCNEGMAAFQSPQPHFVEEHGPSRTLDEEAPRDNDEALTAPAAVEHDDTTMLQGFLDRMRAEKANRKRTEVGTMSERNTTLPPSLATPLRERDANSQSPSPAPRSSPRKDVPSAIGDASMSASAAIPAVDKAKATDATDGSSRKKSTRRLGSSGDTPVASRRSQRQRQAAPSNARPAPASGVEGGASVISVRRRAPSKAPRLVDSAARQLDMLTRANTKRNQSETQPHESAFLESAETTSGRGVRARSRKRVVWDDPLVRYQDRRDQAWTIEPATDTPGRRLRRRA